MDYEKQARERVASNDSLKPFAETIFYDWPDWDSHLEWIATAPVAEIVDWAESVEGYADAVAPARMGRARSKAKARASRENGKRGGRPRQSAIIK